MSSIQTRSQKFALENPKPRGRQYLKRAAKKNISYLYDTDEEDELDPEYFPEEDQEYFRDNQKDYCEDQYQEYFSDEEQIDIYGCTEKIRSAVYECPELIRAIILGDISLIRRMTRVPDFPNFIKTYKNK